MNQDIHALACALGHRHIEIRLRRAGLPNDNGMGWSASLIAENQTTGPAIASATAVTPEQAYAALVQDVQGKLEALVQGLEDRARIQRAVLTGSAAGEKP